MMYNGKDCDFLTLRADNELDMNVLVATKSAGREIVHQNRHQVTSKRDGKKRILAQVMIAREHAK